MNRLARIAKNLIKRTKYWKANYFVLREFRYFWKITLLAVVLVVAAAIFEGFSVGIILTFLQSLTEPEAKPLQTGIEWFDVWLLGIRATETGRIYRISCLILVTTILRSGLAYVGQVYLCKAQMTLIDRLRKRIFSQLERFGLIYFSKTKAGDLTYRLTTEIEKFKQALDMIAILLVKGTTLLAYVISILLISWQLSVIALVVFSLLSSGVSNFIKRVREISFEESRAGQAFTAIALEFISGIRVVQAFGTQDFERKRFYEASQEVFDSAIRVAKFREATVPIVETSSIAVLVGIIIFAFATLIPSGKIQVASLLTFLFVLFRIIPILRQTNKARAKLGEFAGPVSSLSELLREDDKPYIKNGTLQFNGLNKGIELVYASFSYEPKSVRNVLNDVSFVIESGKTTALVGESGSGKSTLADLILRFYDPTSGEILIDGTDLRDLDVTSLRRKVAIVSQDTFIFNTSIRNNIAYGLDNVSEAKIIEAAQQANALEFILDSHDGFETQLGDRGVKLSGGQKQRLAIARALLRNPEILVLDEATSALDSVSEMLIQKAIEELSMGRTVITIAHRLSTIINADKIIVLNKGRVIEQGSYQELIRKKGEFWRYHQLQNRVSPVA